MKTSSTIKALFFATFFFAMASFASAQTQGWDRPSGVFDYTTMDMNATFVINQVIPEGTTLVWDFGDGTIGIGKSNYARHRYQRAGAYEVKIKMFNQYGTKHLSQYIQVFREMEIVSFEHKSN